jgi:hypothetical protein
VKSLKHFVQIQQMKTAIPIAVGRRKIFSAYA